MRLIRSAFITVLLVGLISSLAFGQNRPAKGAAEPIKLPPPPALQSILKSGAAVQGVPTLPTEGVSGRSFISQAQPYLSAGKATEAKEALRTAIRLEPMNLEAWALYDYAVETHYIGRSREEKISPVVERDLQQVFNLGKVDSYMEFGNLYLVGEIKNVSDSVKSRVEITGTLLDKERQELMRENTTITLSDRGVFPGETCQFEIQFKSPPPGVKSYRVRVTNFE